MAINYYNKRLNRGLDKIDDSRFNTGKSKSVIGEKFDIITSKSKILINLRYLIPDSDTNYLRMALAEGKIKSHEINEIVSAISTRIHNFLISRVIKYNKCLEKFSLFRNRVLFNFSSKSAIVKHPNLDDVYGKSYKFVKRTILEISISISELSNFSLKDIFALVKIFLLDDIHFSERVSIQIITSEKSNRESILYKEFTKVQRKDIKSYLTLDDREGLVKYYSNPVIKDLVFEYLFPIGDVVCRITMDKLQDTLPVKKSLRIEKYKDDYIKIVDCINPQSSLEEISNIIHINAIADFYCGTLDTKGQLKYLVFDIDISTLFKLLFTKKILWNFLIEIVRSIISTVNSLGIEGFPVVKFSGSRGMHIVYKYEENILTDEMKRIDLKNYFYMFPGMWELIRSRTSPLKKISTFSRLLADSLIIYMIYRENLEIPQEIKEKLGKTILPTDIFKISIHSDNEAAILIDSSPNSSGVFRTGFSIHPTTKKVSIPIYNTKEGKFIEEFLSYKNVIDESDPDVILKHIEDQDEIVKNYSQLQYAAIITKNDIEELLKPNKLLPFMAFIMRFGRRYALRSIWSFKYWYNHYILQFFFQYAEKIILRYNNQKTKQHIFQEILKIAKDCKIATYSYVSKLIYSYLIKDEITGPVFVDRLRGLYYFEFYYKILPTPLLPEGVEKDAQIILDKITRKQFLQKLHHINLILLQIFSRTLRNPKVSERKLKAFLETSNRFQRLLEEQSKIDNLVQITDDKTKTVRDNKILGLFYTLYVKFLFSFYGYTKIKEVPF